MFTVEKPRFLYNDGKWGQYKSFYLLSTPTTEATHVSVFMRNVDKDKIEANLN